MAKVRLIQKTVGRRNPDGSTYTQKSKTWYLDYGGGDLRSTGITDKKIAEQLRAKREAELILASHGLPIPGDHKRLLLDLLGDYEAKLSLNGSERHVRDTVSIIRKVIKSCRWRTGLSIKEADINHYAVKLHEGRTGRTVQSHLIAVKGFTKWLTRCGKLPVDPLAGVKLPSPRREMRRRMLLPDEWRELRKTTLAEGKEYHGTLATERILLYCTAIQTGYRHNELRSVSYSRGNFFLDSAEPFITCAGNNTKNGKDAKQYIKPELARELRANFDEYGRAFYLPNPMYVVPMLLADLAAARAAWLDGAKDGVERGQREAGDFLVPTNHAGEILEFHSLRHTTGAWLALANCHPKVIQTVMRHADINLTMGTYGHLFPGQVTDAIQKLPDMLGG